MTAMYDSLDSVLLEIDFDGLAASSRYSPDVCIEGEVDVLVFKQRSKTVRDVVVFSMQQAFAPPDHGHFASESAHGLCQLQSDITAADHDEMIRDLVQF